MLEPNYTIHIVSQSHLHPTHPLTFYLTDGTLTHLILLRWYQKIWIVLDIGMVLTMHIPYLKIMLLHAMHNLLHIIHFNTNETTLGFDFRNFNQCRLDLTWLVTATICICMSLDLTRYSKNNDFTLDSAFEKGDFSQLWLLPYYSSIMWTWMWSFIKTYFKSN